MLVKFYPKIPQLIYTIKSDISKIWLKSMHTYFSRIKMARNKDKSNMAVLDSNKLETKFIWNMHVMRYTNIIGTKIMHGQIMQELNMLLFSFSEMCGVYYSWTVNFITSIKQSSSQGFQNILVCIFLIFIEQDMDF